LHKRGELCPAEVCAHRNRLQQRGPLRPSLTRSHGGRSCPCIRKRRHDELLR
jgi:hypothetical protein